MKKLYVGFLTAMVALSLTSCSTFEEVDAPQENLLKSYKLSRDANGAYSIDYIVADNTNSRSFKNINSKINEIYLTEGGVDTKAKYREDFSLDEDEIKIGIFDANSGKQPQILIKDENATFAKGESSEFLKEYSITKNEDGSYQLDFVVNNNVQTEFKYDEDLDVYEIHLSEGTATNKRFSRTIQMPDTGVLQIDFVNHKYAGKALDTEERKPVIIIMD